MVLPLLLVGLAAARLRDARAELIRVAALAAERVNYRLQWWQPRLRRLQEQVVVLAARAEQVGARARQLRGQLPGRGH